MKAFLVSAVLAWCVLAADLSFRHSLSQGALLLPVVCTGVCWFRSPGSLLLGGLVLLLDWIARPTGLPLAPMLLPVFAARLISRDRTDDEDRRVRWFRIPPPLLIPTLTVLGVLLQTCGQLPLQFPVAGEVLYGPFRDQLTSTALVAIPLSAIGALGVRVADEFGLRRSFELPKV